MITKLTCGALHGISAFKVDLEVDMVRQGLPSFIMVGLAEGAVRESKERVLTAIRSSNFRLPAGRITVNFAPADKRKEGSAYDLPLSLGLLSSAGLIDSNIIENYFFAAELSLSGNLRPVSGILPLAILAKEQGARAMIVAEENAAEAAIVEGLEVYGFDHLTKIISFLNGELHAEAASSQSTSELNEAEKYLLDFVEVKGQEHAKRAIEIAAAGAHNLLFIGPPGSGKTMLAQRIPTVLPALNFDEALEITKIYSVTGMLDNYKLVKHRPFRSPHHTVSQIALIGGGASPRPGEVSLAHRGVLFLDELAEYQKSSLEVLRQPLEDGKVTISRAKLSLTFPADFMLIAAMNPCPCGYSTDPKHVCTCSPNAIEKYHSKLSGPLLDRIDLHVEVPAVEYEDLRSKKSGLSSAEMRENILRAREIQTKRYRGLNCVTNANLSGTLLEKICDLGQKEQDFLKNAVQKLSLSARAYTRILRISRTIADLENSENIQVKHLAEAVNCRVLDRKNFYTR